MMYDKAFFDEIIPRVGTACEKWDGLAEREGSGLNPMWVADMDFRCPDEVVQALTERAAHPIYGYTMHTEAAAQAMLDFMRRRHGLSLNMSQQTMLPCVITGLRAAVRVFTQPGDSVIVQPPVYGPFYYSVEGNGRRLAECPLICGANGRYTMDLQSVEDACRAGAKLMLLCNPHNPVGRAWTRDELQALLDVLGRYGVTLVSDEIHEDFVFERGAFVPLLTLDAPEGVRTLSLTSASKTFNLAGLQQAACFCRDEQTLNTLTEEMANAGVVQGNIFGMLATEAAFRHGDAWLDAALAYIKEGEAILREELSARLPEALMSPLEATYLAWVNLRAYGFTTEQLMARCRKAGVEFTPGTFFGKEAGEGYLRVNLACPHSRVREAAVQLEQAIRA